LSRIPSQARRILPICLLVVLGVMYGIASFAPAIGLAYSDGAALVEALTHRINGSPPLFPALLALFAAVSRQAHWLKLAPLLCSFGWLALTRRLLLKMGASRECSWMIAAMTAASPIVLYLATGLFPEPLFALLASASLLALLDEKPLVAGLCAGLASITITFGATLIAACLLTLVVGRRLRSAAIFTCAAMVFAAPWLGWSLAHGVVPFAKLHPNELGVLVGSNAMYLAASPFTLLTGIPGLYSGLLVALGLLIALIRRRQIVPDLFFGFYCLALILRTEPPLRAFAPVLPLFLWMIWRALRVGRFATAGKVASAAMILPALWFGFSSLAKPTGWSEMEKLFAFIRVNTPANTVLLADLDPVLYLNTGRTTVRGFVPDSYHSYYPPPVPLVRPDELLASVRQDHVTYVVLTPDRELPESADYHNAVAALERAGVLEPVSVPGVSAEYRLLHVAHEPGDEKGKIATDEHR